jgi:hypothetical protein
MQGFRLVSEMCKYVIFLAFRRNIICETPCRGLAAWEKDKTARQEEIVD